MTAQRAAGAPHCRNCGAATSGNYCAACGQETRVALPTARQFMREATGRVVAWDGRLWRTLYALACRPGFLTKAYLDGRRRYYVRPARLFLGMSLILFAVIRFEVGTGDTSKLVIIDNIDKATKPDETGAGRAGGEGGAPAKEAATETAMAPSGQAAAREAAKDAAKKKATAELAEMTHSPTPALSIDVDDNMNFFVDGANSYVGAKLRERFERFNKLSPDEKSDRLLDGALRYGSYVLVVLLPVFAALLTLAYVGRAARHPNRPKLYAEHLVYAAHLHTFWFLTLIATLLIPFRPARVALAAWVVFYIARSQKNVYGGAWWGRVPRAVFVAFTYTVAGGVAIAGLVFASILLH